VVKTTCCGVAPAPAPRTPRAVRLSASHAESPRPTAPQPCACVLVSSRLSGIPPQVFGRPSGCPRLLLVDEGFAALDPRAKTLVHAKLRKRCASSLVLVIYHTDSSAADASGAESGGAGNDTWVSASAEGHGGGGGPAASAEQTNSAGGEAGRGCIPAGGFFDANLHFAGGSADLRPLCAAPTARD